MLNIFKNSRNLQREDILKQLDISEPQNCTNEEVIIIEDDKNDQTTKKPVNEHEIPVGKFDTKPSELSASVTHTTQAEDLVDSIKESLITDHSVPADTLNKLADLNNEHEIKQVFESLSETLNTEAISVFGKSVSSFYGHQLLLMVQFYFRYLLLPKV